MAATLSTQDRAILEGLDPSMDHMLLTAFESFIIPIIHAHIPGIVAFERPLSNPVAEGENLLLALNQYVAALVRQKIESVPRKVLLSPTSGRDLERNERNSDDRVTFSTIPEVVTKSPLLQQALDKTQQYVFNEMPIRLLMYDSDGTRIELIDRGEIWRRISTAMEADFDEDAIAVQIRLYQNDGNTKELAEDYALSHFSAKYERYAIMSHTWLQVMPGEVTYTNWREQQFNRSSPGYQKLANFCRVTARDYGLNLAWMDTICINKESSSELDESIRSMYSWYQSAAVCVTYLAHTTQLEQMHADPWFTRGWTLQELIAPYFMKFYTSDWRKIVPGEGDNKQDPGVLQEIYKATTITKDEFSISLGKIPISRRMQWAADRHVTRKEDTAYSLMGIFNVSFSTAYGEGTERAFVRLIKEILNTNTTSVLDIVNHGYGGDLPPDTMDTIRTSSLIPHSPQQYRWRDKSNIIWYPLTTPLTLTQLGLHVSVLLIPALVATGRQVYQPPFTPKGNYFASVFNVGVLGWRNHVSYCNFNLLDRSIFENSSSSRQNMVVFAVFNFSETPTAVSFAPEGLCCAVILQTTPVPFGGVIPENFTSNKWATTHALTFGMQKKRMVSSYTIYKADLQQHGMTLRTVYL